MISPELIRLCPFFAGLEEKDLGALAMVAKVVSYQSGETIYANGQTSHELYVLLSGNVELYTLVEDEAGQARDFFLGHVDELDVFGLSSLAEPFTHSSTARATVLSQIIRIDAQKLRWEIDADYRLGYIIMSHATRSLLDRLHHTRLQLAQSVDTIEQSGAATDTVPALFWFKRK